MTLAEYFPLKRRGLVGVEASRLFMLANPYLSSSVCMESIGFNLKNFLANAENLEAYLAECTTSMSSPTRRLKAFPSQVGAIPFGTLGLSSFERHTKLHPHRPQCQGA